MKVIHRYIRRVILSLCTACLWMSGSCAQALAHVENWARDGVLAAQQAGLEPAVLAEAEGGEPITRAEFAAVALSAYEAVSGEQAELGEGEGVFPDCDDPVVAAASRLGLVRGRSDGTFAPGSTINRQELCVMLAGVARAAGCEAPLAEESASDLSRFPDGDTVDWWAEEAVTAMLGHGVMSGVSTYGEVTLEPFGVASRQQALLLAVRFVETFASEEPTPDPTLENATPAFDIKGYDFTRNYLSEIDEAARLKQVFGEGGAYYATEAEAEAAMETITVPVWRLKEDGTKRAGEATLTVNESLSGIVKEIFEEIYAGAEQFPIKDVGGYAWRASETSEHRWGTAIDINWEENYEARIEEDGTLTALTGEYWRPGEDPYSIPADGDVVRAFKGHGFTWGGDAWSSKRDYMHFSFFGR